MTHHSDGEPNTTLHQITLTTHPICVMCEIRETKNFQQGHKIKYTVYKNTHSKSDIYIKIK